MADFLRVQDGVAVEAWSEPEGFTLEECFAPSIAKTFHPKGSADVGWAWNGSKFVAPAAPEPPPPNTVVTFREFMALFTPSEQAAMFTARRDNVQIDMFITLAAAGNIDLVNSEVVTDIGVCVTAGLLTSQRAAAILAGQAPTS